jgi:tetratricopeptide (TPR) repeat protein
MTDLPVKKIFALLILWNTCLSGQELPAPDTLTLARNLAAEQKIPEASALLSAYSQLHKNPDALQLYARILYWQKDFKTSVAVYEKALVLFPGNPEIQFNYGKMLFEINRFQKAGKLLRAIPEHNPEYNAAITMLAYIDLWSGKIKQAAQKAAWLRGRDTANADAAEIQKLIHYYTTPYLSLDGSFYQDDQPLRRTGTELESGVFTSWALAPYLRGVFYRIENGDLYNNSAWILAGNKMQMATGKTQLEYAAGIFRANNFSQHALWKLKLMQKISGSLSLDASVEKRPYQYTQASIKNPFLFQLTESGLNFDQKNRWLGRAAVYNQGFEDGNHVYTVYFWLLAPVVHKNIFHLKAGYAYAFSNSSWNTYMAKNNIPVPPVSNVKVQGEYDPYFTNKDQHVHSLLAAIKIPFSNTTIVSFNVSYGFSARASQPVLYAERPVPGPGPVTIHKKYEDYRYNPIELTGDIQLKLSEKLYVSGKYLYSSLIFFNSHTIHARIKYLFSHAHR